MAKGPDGNPVVVENAELLKARYVEKFSSGGAAKASPPGRNTLHDCRSHETLGYILSEQAEIGVTVRPVDMLEHPQLLSCGRAQQSADAVLRKDNPLARRLDATWDDIRTSRILLLPQSSAASRLVASVVSAQAVRFDRVFEVSLIDTALGMAAAGYGVVVLPSYVKSRHRADSVVYRPIQGASAQFHFSLQYLRGVRFREQRGALPTTCARTFKSGERRAKTMNKGGERGDPSGDQREVTKSWRGKLVRRS
ncbi:LysR substrate-binding domain-containing protein [Mesorhizobium sp. 8]|uniref:LysR substrate-binding domain-containing protein n=1 Tax=Mesorhizobium sp. 8 TaxID=2584466 RepID=UPI0015D66748|nr:LysR substrate-binding domain-containing protein [Mesorhizobium sp. 8]